MKVKTNETNGGKAAEKSVFGHVHGVESGAPASTPLAAWRTEKLVVTVSYLRKIRRRSNGRVIPCQALAGKHHCGTGSCRGAGGALRSQCVV